MSDCSGARTHNIIVFENAHLPFQVKGRMLGDDRRIEKCPRLRQSDLTKHVQALSSVLSQRWCYKLHTKPG